MSETTNNGTTQAVPVLQKPSDKDPNIFEFDWLHNEALLRDEGAYYGLVTEQHPQEKLNTIDSFFEEIIARIQRSIELQEEGLGYFDEEIVESKTTLDNLKKQLEQASTQYFHESNHFWFLIAGIIAYTLIAIFVFWLPYELFGPAWRMPIFITLGIFLFGLFSHYHRPSWWYENEQNLKAERPAAWKVIDLLQRQN